MYQPKVENTQKYEDSQGSHVVATGKLIIIKSKEMDSVATRNDVVTGINRKSIIISETEEIEEGDKILYQNRIHTVARVDNLEDDLYLKDSSAPSGEGDFIDKSKVNKILALPEHFSDKHLQAIVDGKMEGGDEVLVKCDRYSNNDPLGGYASKLITKIHLDQQNHITLFPAKQSLEEAAYKYSNSDEAINEISDLPQSDQHEYAFKAGAKWAKKNNY